MITTMTTMPLNPRWSCLRSLRERFTNACGECFGPGTTAVTWSLKVVVREYTDINTRPNVARAFERCGYSVVPSQQVSVYVTKLISTKTLAAQDKFVKKVNKTLEDEEEVSIQEDWEFLTEEEMQDANWSENLA